MTAPINPTCIALVSHKTPGHFFESVEKWLRPSEGSADLSAEAAREGGSPLPSLPGFPASSPSPEVPLTLISLVGATRVRYSTIIVSLASPISHPSC